MINAQRRTANGRTDHEREHEVEAEGDRKARGIMIRPYEAADLATIMDIGNRAWRGIHGMFRRCYGDELFEVIVPDEAVRKGRQIKAHCEAHPEWVFVCRERGRIVGFVTFIIHPGGKIGEIGNNAVDGECGLKGVGQQMYAAVLDHFRRLGLRFAKVHTGLDEAHARARGAYERAGFDIHHEEVTYHMKL